MKFIKQFLLPLLPIEIFLLVAAYQGFSDTGWILGFHWGAGSALLVLGFMFFLKQRLSDILLAIFLFLIGGSLSFVFSISSLSDFYDHYQEASFWLIFVATECILLTNQNTFSRFIDMPMIPDPFRFFFLAYLCFSIPWALHFKGNIFLSVGLPFLITRVLLSKIQIFDKTYK